VITLSATVSRKTPLDGRLEIPASLADRLLSSEQSLQLWVYGAEGSVQVEEMACTCSKAAGPNHVHSFLASDILRALPPNANVTLTVDLDSGVIRIDGASD
jgi:hypothetical protein